MIPVRTKCGNTSQARYSIEISKTLKCWGNMSITLNCLGAYGAIHFLLTHIRLHPDWRKIEIKEREMRGMVDDVTGN